jgi:hypothetical protein
MQNNQDAQARLDGLSILIPLHKGVPLNERKKETDADDISPRRVEVHRHLRVYAGFIA